ncbi:MAG: hypothetical protein A2Y82_05175 [Candidatus Buchananbacteria bacterium RBG_13_36_9]|uniref:Uncharacterized protein n=1 Tax=Candidatus Buchananbacteria bacterium RBG_13_36_9 TaxID=1797530 RepID=A0A1G1XPE3_9BACT|nr:MAG: hypothetical protein A2Y82_05175 [Candidatus Buchananbacteria bacterium RBG_13_36_9]
MSAQRQDESESKQRCLGWCEGKNRIVEGTHYCRGCNEKRLKISRSHHLLSFATKAKSSFKAPPLL